MTPPRWCVARLCLSALPWLFTVWGVAAAGNLMRDGGFENTPGAWAVPTGATITTEVAHSGAAALRLSSADNAKAWCTVSGLKPGQFYRVDAWVLTRGMPAKTDGYAAIYMDGVGSFTANLDDHGWELVTAWFAARDDQPFRVYLLRSGIAPGEVFFDDVSLYECADPNLAPVTFEDGSAIGLRFYQHPGTIARVVDLATPQGSRFCLLGAPASIGYSMPQDITAGRVEFDFMIRLKTSTASARFAFAGLQLDLSPQIVNHETRDGQPGRQALGAFSPGRWYRLRGIVNLDTQRYDLDVTDFEDPLYSFTRRNLNLAGRTDKVRNFWLSAPKDGAWVDDLYLGPVRPAAAPR